MEDFFEKLKKGLGDAAGIRVIDPGKFQKGEAVLLHGLKAKPELNECHGTVIGEETNGRYPIRLSKDLSIRVRAENLKQRVTPDVDPQIARQMKLLPLPWDVKASLAFVANHEMVDQVRLESFKGLYEHAGTVDGEHQRRLVAAGLPDTMVVLISDASSSTLIKCAACGTLQNFATHEPNIASILNAGGVDALAKIVREGNEAILRETALDALHNISNDANGKLVVGKRALKAVTGALADSSTCGKSHESALAILGSLLYHQECWNLMLRAGVLEECVALLRRPACTVICEERAVGLLYILAMTTKEMRTAIRHAGGLEPLHRLSSSGSGKVKDSARAAMEIFAKRGELNDGPDDATD